MRLALSTKIIFWLASREQQGIQTTRKNVYDYWVTRVSREEITDCLSSLIFQTLVEDIVS